MSCVSFLVNRTFLAADTVACEAKTRRQEAACSDGKKLNKTNTLREKRQNTFVSPKISISVTFCHFLENYFLIKRPNQSHKGGHNNELKTAKVSNCLISPQSFKLATGRIRGEM